jgi:hypothetical protein
VGAVALVPAITWRAPIREGKSVRFQEFYDEQSALRAVGLGEVRESFHLTGDSARRDALAHAAWHAPPAGSAGAMPRRMSAE